MATEQDLLQLSMLPLSGFSDATLTVVAARDKWNETRRIVNTVMSAGITLGAQLQQSLNNLKHYVDTAMNAIHTFETRGGSALENVLQVEGLEDARIGFLNELPKTQALFTQVQAERGVDPKTQFVQSVAKLTAPPTESKIVATGLLLAGLWLVKVAFFD